MGSQFGETCGIYTENAEQGLSKPCFLIETAETAGGQYRGNKYWRETGYRISYYPAGAEPAGECNAMAERLFWLLECIPFENGTIRGTKMRGEFENQMLKFFVSYKRFLLSVPESEQMENVKIGMNMKDQLLKVK